MPIDNPELLWKPVVRYGAPAGKDDLSIPQVWIEPHSFLIHRVTTIEGGKVLRVDYGGHGSVDANLPWLPSTIAASLDDKILWTATLTQVLDRAPNDQMFSLTALEAEATP